ncbi:hypothetical protein LDENG_00191160 [Lucifuga dentata]|nr:hypothetical protein LDENG_00191160 [Lucifuga dentata]
MRRHGISFHSYADDTQLYMAMSLDENGPVDSLFNCMLDINSWMSQNFLQLSQDKTEVLITGSNAQRKKLATKLNLMGLKMSQYAKNLRVIFDSELDFKARTACDKISFLSSYKHF